MKCFYRLIQGDCLAVLPTLEDESIDLIITDPPFNIGKKYGRHYNDKRTDYFSWCENWIKECFRVLKSSGSFYMMNYIKNIKELLIVLDKYGIRQNIIIWARGRPPDTKRYLGFYQPIFFYTKTKNYTFNAWAALTTSKSIRALEIRKKKPELFKSNKRRLTDVWTDINEIYSGAFVHPEAVLNKNGKRVHPTQMPLGLARRPIKISSNKSDIVLDLFMGSGTVMDACQELSRNCLGIELSSKYCDLIKRRCFGRQFLDREVEYEFEVFK